MSANNTVFSTKVVSFPKMTVAEGVRVLSGELGALRGSIQRVDDKCRGSKGAELQSGIDELDKMNSQIQSVAGPSPMVSEGFRK